MGTAFLLNIRALCLLPFFLAVLAADNRLWGLAVPRLCTSGILCASAAMTVCGVYRAGQIYNAEVVDYVNHSESLPSHATLAVETNAVPTGSSWPPFRLSMGIASFSARKLVFSDSIFINDQMPVHERVKGAYVRLQRARQEFVRHLYERQTDGESVNDLWALADGVFVQGADIRSDTVLQPDRARLLASGRKWLLLGASMYARECNDTNVCGRQYGCAQFTEPATACWAI